jgi:hypothetical protein
MRLQHLLPKSVFESCGCSPCSHLLLSLPPSQLQQPAASSVRYVVVVVYVGNQTAAANLVADAEEDLNKIGNLAEAVSTATNGAITVTQVNSAASCQACRPVGLCVASGLWL